MTSDLLEENADLRKQVEELEKENAELKGLKNVATLINANNDTVITLMQLNNMLVSKNQQLTKAKEIIEGLMRFCRCFAQHHTEDIRYKEAEEFMQEK